MAVSASASCAHLQSRELVGVGHQLVAIGGPRQEHLPVRSKMSPRWTAMVSVAWVC